MAEKDKPNKGAKNKDKSVDKKNEAMGDDSMLSPQASSGSQQSRKSSSSGNVWCHRSS